MKQFSILFNIILLAAVGVLYYLHFSTGKSLTPQRVQSANSHKDTCSAGPAIAYVELDSLNNNVVFIKERKRELEQEQKQILNAIAVKLAELNVKHTFSLTEDSNLMDAVVNQTAGDG